VATADTKERILDAAEALFARQGFAATSLRNVIAEAGVNLAAIHYHFGSKEGLIRALLARRFAPLNAERLRLLADYERTTAARSPSVDALLEMFIRPALPLAGAKAGGLPLLGSLLGRLHSEPGSQLRELLREQFAEVSERYAAALGKALPHLPTEEVYCRFHFVIGAMASMLGDPERLEFISHGTIDASEMETIVAYLMTFLAAALNAPLTAVAPPGAVSEEPRAVAAGSTGRRGSRSGRRS
jgi:AcrR family transcriptional regulator